MADLHLDLLLSSSVALVAAFSSSVISLVLDPGSEKVGGIELFLDFGEDAC